MHKQLPRNKCHWIRRVWEGKSYPTNTYYNSFVVFASFGDLSNLSIPLQVYRGMLLDGKMVAIKRSKVGSSQGGLEFKTEIELLSRVHHKNLVDLVGFCFQQGEKTLVYEYVPKGTLRESLAGMLYNHIMAIAILSTLTFISVLVTNACNLFNYTL